MSSRCFFVGSPSRREGDDAKHRSFFALNLLCRDMPTASMSGAKRCEWRRFLSPSSSSINNHNNPHIFITNQY